MFNKAASSIQVETTEVSHLLSSPSLSHVMRKPVFAICEQQRLRLACASVQSDQHLRCLLPR